MRVYYTTQKGGMVWKMQLRSVELICALSCGTTTILEKINSRVQNPALVQPIHLD